jgi:hypothetical protein
MNMMTIDRPRRITEPTDLVVFTRLPNGVLQVRLTEAARAGLISDQRQQFRDGVRAAVTANAAEISSRRRWRAISRRSRIA